MSYKLSVEAKKDLQNIWLYSLETWSIDQADRYINLLIDEMEYLAINPETGKVLNHIREDYLCSKVKSHLIFYRKLKKKKTIEIIRILHQRMDIATRLKN
ncbi:MAG: type II toxin-antitoxin system RelE/ParE family toxin [Chitinophagaceae bacterium]